MNNVEALIITEIPPPSAYLPLAEEAAELLVQAVYDEDKEDELYQNILLSMQLGHTVAALDTSGSILGAGVIEPIGSDTVNITEIAVVPNYQGRGIGQKIMKLLENISVKTGNKQIEVYVMYPWIEGFYENEELGYERFEGGKYIKSLCAPSAEELAE